MADLFIMPSRKEGFGIVFLEALLCGLPVIGGNQDGTVDALKNGELGLLIDPDNKAAIIKSIQDTLLNKAGLDNETKLAQQARVLHYFGFDHFKARLKKFLLPSSVQAKQNVEYSFNEY